MANIKGTKKDNKLEGTKKSDVIHGLGGDDTIWGWQGDDKIFGGDGNDHLVVHLGKDKIDGGKGIDIIDFYYATAGVTIDLNEKTVSYAIGAETGRSDFKSIEEVRATNFADIVTGDDKDNNLFTYDGNDTIVGGGGNDVVNGGSDDDVAEGDAGDDTFIVSSGEDDFDGGEGSDYLDFYYAIAGVTLSLASGTVDFENVSGTGTTTFSGVENAWGSAFDDMITGDDGANILLSGDGNDTVEGGAGDDTINGSTGDDTINGGDDDDKLVLSSGDDEIDGGDGSDALDFFYSETGVTVSVDDASVEFTNDVGSGTAVFLNIEDILGSNFGDVLSGNADSNWLAGRDGNDLLTALDGDDVLSGGNGNDTMNGGIGADAFVFTSAAHNTKNFDVIDDFVAVDDGLYFDDAVFKLTGTGAETEMRSYKFKALDAIQFQSGEGSAALNKNVRLIYETDTGILYYDADGSKSGKAIRVAELDSGLALTSGDFFVV